MMEVRGLQFMELVTIVENKKVALSALGENMLRKVVKKVDNAKITTYATI